MARTSINIRSGDRPMPPAIRFFFSWIFPLIFVAAGTLLLIFGINGVNRAIASSDWPSVTGTIVTSEVVREQRRDSDGRRTTVYRADIAYEYEVDGARYLGDSVAVGDFSSSSRARADRITRQYPVDAQVEVFYDPEEPVTSLLEPGVSAKAFAMPGIGAVFLAAGLVMLYFLPRLISRAHEQSMSDESAEEANSQMDAT
jgi:hypothetical protein